MSSGCSASSPELTSRRHFRDSEGCHGRAFPANRVTAMRRAHYGSVCTPMLLEERFGASQPLGGYEDVAAPTQHERASPSSADPVADLVADYSPQDTEHDDVAQVEASPLDQDACCKEYGLAGQGHPCALEHHPEEDDQVSVLLDEREDPVHSRRV